jgi:hypothetical protein
VSAAGARRRVLVVPDAGDFGLAAVEQAVSLALRIDAELSAIFLENADLFRLAMLPFARETGTTSGLARPLEPAALEAAMRRDARRVRQALQAAAGRHGLAWSLRVQRGRLAREVLTAAAEVEAVLLGWRPPAAPSARRQRHDGCWVALLPDAGKVAQRLLERVLDLATGACRELRVLVPGASPQALDELMPRALGPGAPAVILRVHPGQAEAVSEAARDARAELLILAGVAPGLMTERTLADLLARSPCPVLLLGEASGGAG